MELWYAVRVRSNQEKMVHASLVAKGIEAFLPTYRRSMRWSDRMKMLETPLFPGYVFGRFDAVRRLPILLTPGVVHILGNSTGPLPVDDDELAAVRRLAEQGERVAPCPYLSAGDRVEVERGPLSGMQGILLRVKDDVRLVVSLSLLQRSVAVEMSRADLRLVASLVTAGSNSALGCAARRGDGSGLVAPCNPAW